MYICGVGSISALGCSQSEISKSYCLQNSNIKPLEIEGFERPASPLSQSAEEKISALRRQNSAYSDLDRSVMLAVYAARQAYQAAGFEGQSRCAVNIGSSRGATSLFEKHHEDFLKRDRHRVSPHASPTTTLGNISSWVAEDLALDDFEFSHSVTCSSSIQAIANGIAWLRSGMAERFLVGGSEAALTGFSLAQLAALRIYSSDLEQEYPCRPLSNEIKNSFVLGEGAAVFALEAKLSERSLALVSGIGLAREKLSTLTGISEAGSAFQISMQRAMQSAKTDQIDLLVLHAPGTEAGDRAEYQAVTRLFPEKMPFLTSNKWRIGHTLGASAAHSVEYALFMLRGGKPSDFPYPSLVGAQKAPSKIKNIMINSAGFGGNAASLILSPV